eukprot:Platyproteum_vivax@DN2611_c0_g1_i1.p1
MFFGLVLAVACGLARALARAHEFASFCHNINHSLDKDYVCLDFVENSVLGYQYENMILHQELGGPRLILHYYLHMLELIVSVNENEQIVSFTGCGHYLAVSHRKITYTCQASDDAPTNSTTAKIIPNILLKFEVVNQESDWTSHWHSKNITILRNNPRVEYSIVLPLHIRILQPRFRLRSQLTWKLPSNFWDYVALNVNNLTTKTNKNVWQVEETDGFPHTANLNAFFHITINTEDFVKLEEDLYAPLSLKYKVVSEASGKFWGVSYTMPTKVEMLHEWTGASKNVVLHTSIELERGVWLLGSSTITSRLVAVVFGSIAALIVILLSIVCIVYTWKGSRSF